MENNFKVQDIPGWGMDADPENEPTYPIKNYTGDDHNRINYERSTPQLANVEILKSNERPVMTTVFGTSNPPSGWSGAIRRYAFKHSEDRYRHWIPLILADRVNMVEGLVDDLKRGYMPNMIAERGWRMEWKYNKKGVISKLATVAVTALVVCWALKKKRRN